MPQNSHPHLIGQVQARAILFQNINHAQRLLVMVEGRPHHLGQRNLSGVAEGRMSEIMSKSNGLGQILVQTQRADDHPGNPRHFERMGHTGTVMISLRLQKNLRLVHQAPEGLAVQNSVGIPLVAGAHIVFRFGFFPQAAPRGVRELRQSAQAEVFLLFQLFTDRHCQHSPFENSRSVRMGIYALPTLSNGTARYSFSPVTPSIVPAERSYT